MSRVPVVEVRHPVSELPGPGSDAAFPSSVVGLPPGEVYDWYVSARELHDGGDPAAAIPLLQWAIAAEPGARSVREALARAEYDAHRFSDAASSFRVLVELDPVDHYAHFGLGLASSRTNDLDVAVTHLALAVALRPDLDHYASALRSARASLRVRDGGSIGGDTE